MADTKFMSFAEVTPDITDSVLVANGTNGVRRARLASIREVVTANFTDMLRKALQETGLRVQFGENGYICFGELFNKLTIQWGLKTTKVLNDFAYVETQYPISFSKNPTVIPSVAENSSNENAGFIMAEASVSVEKATFVIRSNGKTTNDFRMRWLAVGFC